MTKTHHRLLLVDDDPAVRRVLAAYLKPAGYDVEQAADGQDALRAIEKQCPDFLVTDWEMPHVNGIELCREVRRRKLSNYVYIFILTSRDSSQEMIRGLDEGADDFLAKPVTRGELLARLRAGTRILDLKRRLTDLARTDSLTGMPTQGAFFAAVSRELKRAARNRHKCSCVMLDIDYFKRINDTHGHGVGDVVLKHVARIIRDDCRDTDFVCRYGGEEFCMFLPETDEHQASVRAERLRSTLAEHVVTAEGRSIKVTASFGVAERELGMLLPEKLTGRADQALLVAKKSGRNRVVRINQLDEEGALKLDVLNHMKDPFRGAVAREVMIPCVVCLQEDESVGQAAAFFRRLGITTVPIVDKDQLLVGILSERDIMEIILVPDAWNRPVSEVMTSSVVTFDEDTPVRVVYELYCRVTLRRVIVQRDGMPTGIIGRGSLLHWICNRVVVDHFGLPTSAGLWSQGPLSESKTILAESARALARQAEQLEREIFKSDDDVGACVIANVSRIQELINHLLASSGWLHNSSYATARQLVGGNLPISTH